MDKIGIIHLGSNPDRMVETFSRDINFPILGGNDAKVHLANTNESFFVGCGGLGK